MHRSPPPFPAAALAAAYLAGLLVATTGCEQAEAIPVQTRTFESNPYKVDQVYRSMKGPMRTAGVRLSVDSPPELIWVLSYSTEIVDPTSGEKLSDEFMCHNNLQFEDARGHEKRLGRKSIGLRTSRVFTLSQGAMSVDFPAGFGVPMMSDEKLKLVTQVLNLNPINQTRQVKYRTTVKYVRDSDVRGRLRPLYQRGVQGLKLLSGPDGYFGVDHGDSEGHGESCAVGELAGKRTIQDTKGREFAAHWVVEPGREENHTLATEMLGLTRDTTAHYIAVHMHPFAESVELRDLTTGETLFKSRATNRRDRIGLERVENFSSAEGLQLYKDHEYTLISIYDNTSGVPQDAMAVMYIYVLDKYFEERPAQAGA